jgi:NAD(P)-dependent dehydrogenase (short-subunit alcohol dehydrogenase family)
VETASEEETVMTKPVAVVVGVGPGLGSAVARRFAAAGMAVAVARRQAAESVGLAEEIGEDAVLAPEAIAEAYYQLHAQPRSAWTQELDLRPCMEKF